MDAPERDALISRAREIVDELRVDYPQFDVRVVIEGATVSIDVVPRARPPAVA